MDKENFAREILEMMPHVIRVNRWMSQSAPGHAEYFLPPTQGQTLVMLKKYGTLNMTHLAELLMMTRQQLTKIVDALVEKGFVRRGPDSSNRRYVMISLTPQGEDYLETVFTSAHGVMVKMREKLDTGQQKRLLEALRTVREILSQIELD